MFFICEPANMEHIAKHGVEPFEAEEVVRRARRPYPRRSSGVKWLVRRRTSERRLIQVIYVIREASDIDVTILKPEDIIALEVGEAVVYFIHSRPLRAGES